MKKTTKWLAGLFAAALVCGTFAGCGKTNTKKITEPNLLDTVQKVESNGSKYDEKGNFSGKAGARYTITFAQETKVNTVVLHEKGRKNFPVEAFQIEAMKDGKYEIVTQQDKIQQERYCTFPEVSTTALRITVTKTKGEKDFHLQNTAVYNIHTTNNNFRVTAYLIAERAYDPAKLDVKSFDVITDVILFGLTAFDENGKVSFNEVEIDGKKTDGKLVFEQALKNVRAISEKRKTPLKIYCNFLGPNPKEQIDNWNKSMAVKGDLHMQAMKDNESTLIQGITNILDEYNLDGVLFDYEYPLKQKHLKMYSDFLVALKGKLGSKKLGIALAPWGTGISKEAKQALDLVEVMSYDLFDENGDHSPFYSCATDAVDSMLKAGFQPEQLDLGIPFYARPADKGAFWYDYSSEAEKLGKYGNKAVGKASDAGDPSETRYYNGYQMVYDKTAYALDQGVGGMMVWHYSCDLPYENELSLFRAMGDSIADRK